MDRPLLPAGVLFAALLATAALPGAAAAQASAPLPDLPAASRALSPAARASAAAGPRARSPADTAKSAIAPGDQRPERPVTPQLSIPFGKVPPPPPKRDRAAAPGPSATDGIDDAAARCESQPDARLRADCRAAIAPKPAPASKPAR